MILDSKVIRKKDGMIAYFGFGTNKDKDMMAHMIGRSEIEGEPGKLLGYDVCIQKAHQFRTEIPKTSPIDISPRDIIINSWGPDFEMFVSRPNPKGETYGTIWYITSDELELVREWEIVDYGAQEDAYGVAVNPKGQEIEVITQSFLKPTEIDRVVVGADYEPYIWSKDAMLKRADEIREQYLGFKNQNNS
jgi:hypothetical protein